MKKFLIILILVLSATNIFCRNVYQCVNLNRLTKVTFTDGTLYE